jgi:multiple sugar transport system substrate-binding protein
MSNIVLKVLAVADPAIMVYVDKKINLLREFGKQVYFEVVPWTEYYKKMLEAFIGKTSYYDIVMVAGHLWKRDFVDKGYIVPIELEDEDILPVIAKELKYNGKSYLSPSFCDGHMIVYRKSVIEKRYGKLFDDVISPTEYVNAAISIGNSEDMSAVAMKAHESEIFTDALPFLRMNGGDVYDFNTLKSTCEDERVIKGLETYCDLRHYAHKDTDLYGNDEISESICKKRAAMAVTWSGQLGIINNEYCIDKQDLGFATFNTSWNVTWSFAICSRSGEKKLANEFLRFLRSPKIDAIAGAYSGCPVRKQSYIEGIDKYPWYSSQLKMFEKAKPLPDLKEAGAKNGILYEEIAHAFVGRKTPRQAMEAAKIRIDSLVTN